MLMRLRKWLILRLAGRMGVVLNATPVIGVGGRPEIAYAGRFGGLCERMGVK